MIKALRKLGIEGNFIYENLRHASHVGVKDYRLPPVRLGTRQACSLPALQFYIVLEVLAVQRGKKKK